MKGNKKQRIKRIVAFSMALIMVLLPMNGSVPETFGTDMDTADNSEMDSTGTSIPVSIADAEDISINGTGITYDSDTNQVTIDEDTPEDTTVRVNFSLPMNKKADMSLTGITYNGVAEGKRSFTYNTTVAGLLTDGISLESSDAYFSITTDGNTTVSISGGWGDSAGTLCYEPLKPDEAFTLTVTPAAGYELNTSTVGGTSYLNQLVKGTGSYTISSNALNPLGAIQAASVLAPPTIPKATFGKIEDWYKGSAAITVTIPAGDMPSGCKLQYAFALEGQEPVTWTDVSGFTNDGKPCEVTVSYGFSGNGKLYLRYARTADGAGSSSVSSGLIHFDSTAPSDVKADIYVKGIENNDLEWINAVDTANIRISATEQGSGLDRLEYKLDGNAQTPISKVTATDN
ncbi:MAG: hypothetical protein K2N24_02145, partial [Lachnospiraceae bacterium]|nr:hypothetical protein [Lachnospiraceae bacterium]